jgi:hypothetical protein
MKRLIILTVLIFIFSIVPTSFALEGAQSSGARTSSASICTNCYLAGLQVTTNGSADATVTLYDNASAASGTVLAKMVVFGGLQVDYRQWPIPVQAVAGIYAVVSGTDAGYTVEYYEK